MLFRVLGPIEVDVGGRVVAPTGRPRALLAALLLHAGTVVPIHAVVAALWGDDPPASAENAVHVVVGRLRRTLGSAAHRLVTRSPGYALDLTGAELDAAAFEQECRTARTVDPAAAVALLDRALARWRGPAYAEYGESFARPAAVRLEELRRSAAAGRAEALLLAGRADEAVGAARDLVAAQPLDERPVAVLLRALVAVGRTPDALEAYRRHGEILRDELGLDPSPVLRDLHARVLRADEEAPAPRASRPGHPTGRRPRRPSPLLGRDAELAALQGETVLQAGTEGLCTLVGPGGVGKTRLAIELAHRFAAAGRPVWWVDLVPADPGRPADAVASATGVELSTGVDPAVALTRALTRRRGVLVLDNAEHLLDPLAELVEQLRDAAPGLAILVTSRERLALDGERVRAVPPLRVPDGADPQNAAVRLFLARAPGLADGRVDLELVATACRRLDGLPLAIELGAARAAALGLPALVDRLAGRLDVLGGGRRTADRRHRTLRAVVEWSHDLLDPAEAAVFRRLGIFPAAFSLDRAEAVCAGGPVDGRAVAGRLAGLVERSLVQKVDRDRFTLLETLRAFAVDRLDASGERPALAQRHARDTAERLAAATPRLRSPDEAAAVEELTDLTPDLHTAFTHAATHDRPLALRLVGDVFEFAYFRQRLDLLRWGLTVADWSVDDPELAPALGTAAAALWSAGRIDEAMSAADRGIAVAGGPDAPAAALATEVSGDVAMFLGRTDDAVARYRRHGALMRRAGDLAWPVLTEISVAHALANGRRREEAAAVLAAALPRAERTGVPTVRAWAHYVAGEVTTDGDVALAEYRTAAELADGADSRLFASLARSSAATLLARTGAVGEALTALAAALENWVRLGNDYAAWVTLQYAVAPLAAAGADADAAILAGAFRARALPFFAVDAARVEAAMDGIRARLGGAAVDELSVEGAAMTPDVALAHAFRALAAAGVSGAGAGPPAGRPRP